MNEIVIIEDEERIAQILADYLQAANFSTKIFSDGREGLLYCLGKQPHLLLLDYMLPSMDGLEICKKLREKSSLPIIMLTAKVEEEDRLSGLQMGVDDYICKPFSPREVVARVQAVLRRVHPAPPKEKQTDQFILNENDLEVCFQNKTVRLTAIEFRIFLYLSSCPDRVLSRGQIMNAAYRDGRTVSDRTVDSHIKKLRHKVFEICPEHEVISSVYSMGYRFNSL